MFHYVISMQKYKNTQLNAVRLLSAKVQKPLNFFVFALIFSIYIKAKMKNGVAPHRIFKNYRSHRSAFMTEKKNNILAVGLLKKCGVMEALNRHERFILESPIIPLNAYPFVY